MADTKLNIPIAQQLYYDEAPLGSIKAWNAGVAARATTALISGTATTDTENKLIYATGGFSATVSAGDIVYNVDDDCYAIVVSVDSDTQLTLEWDCFNNGSEDFEVYSIPSPGYGYIRIDSATVISDADSPYNGMSVPGYDIDLYKHYETDWTQYTSDWGNTDFTINHNLFTPLERLRVRFFISTDGTHGNSFELYDTAYNRSDTTATNDGFTLHETNLNTIVFNTPVDGITYIRVDNALDRIDSENYYHKFVVDAYNDGSIIPIMKVKSNLAVMGALSASSIQVGGYDVKIEGVGINNTFEVLHEFIFSEDNELDYTSTVNGASAGSTVTIVELPATTVSILVSLNVDSTGDTPAIVIKRSSGGTKTFSFKIDSGSGAASSLDGIFEIPTNGNSFYHVSSNTITDFTIIGYKTT